MSAAEPGPEPAPETGGASHGADGAPELCAPAAAATEGTAAQAEDASRAAETPVTQAAEANGAPAKPQESAESDSPSKCQKVDSTSGAPEKPVTSSAEGNDAAPTNAEISESSKRQKADESPPEPAPSGPKRLKVSDLLGSFERTLKETAPPPQTSLLSALLALPSLETAVPATAVPATAVPGVPASSPARETAEKPRKFDDGKCVLVVRHGEGFHQLKGYTPKEGDLLGPELTNKGKEQAHAAQKTIASELQKLGLQEAWPLNTLVVSSNLLRAVHTALLLESSSKFSKSKVLVHPCLRERILDGRDEPSELNHLREWLMDREFDEQVDLGLYEEALIEAGSKATDFASMDLHEIYLRSCRASDLKGDAWNAKQNKEMLQERAASFTHWLEEHSCQVAVLVGHACFLGMLTGDKEWLENGEVRSYSLQQGYYTRLSPSSKVARRPGRPGPAAPSAAPNIPAAGVGRGFPFRWPPVRAAAPVLRPRGSLIPRPSR